MIIANSGAKHRHQQVTETLEVIGPVDSYGVKELAEEMLASPAVMTRSVKPTFCHAYIASTVGNAVRRTGRERCLGEVDYSQEIVDDTR